MDETRNGVTKRKSRYLTLSAVTHKPGARLTREATATKKDNSRICQSRTNLYQAIIITRKLMKKSTTATTTTAMGTINLGKYTLLIRCRAHCSATGLASNDAHCDRLRSTTISCADNMIIQVRIDSKLVVERMLVDLNAAYGLTSISHCPQSSAVCNVALFQWPPFHCPSVAP